MGARRENTAAELQDAALAYAAAVDGTAEIANPTYDRLQRAAYRYAAALLLNTDPRRTDHFKTNMIDHEDGSVYRIDTCAECPCCAPITEPVSEAEAFLCAHPSNREHRDDRVPPLDGIPPWCPIREEHLEIAVTGSR